MPTYTFGHETELLSSSWSRGDTTESLLLMTIRIRSVLSAFVAMATVAVIDACCVCIVAGCCTVTRSMSCLSGCSGDSPHYSCCEYTRLYTHLTPTLVVISTHAQSLRGRVIQVKVPYHL